MFHLFRAPHWLLTCSQPQPAQIWLVIEMETTRLLVPSPTESAYSHVECLHGLLSLLFIDCVSIFFVSCNAFTRTVAIVSVWKDTNKMLTTRWKRWMNGPNVQVLPLWMVLAWMQTWNWRRKKDTKLKNGFHNIVLNGFLLCRKMLYNNVKDLSNREQGGGTSADLMWVWGYFGQEKLRSYNKPPGMLKTWFWGLSL